MAKPANSFLNSAVAGYAGKLLLCVVSAVIGAIAMIQLNNIPPDSAGVKVISSFLGPALGALLGVAGALVVMRENRRRDRRHYFDVALNELLLVCATGEEIEKMVGHINTMKFDQVLLNAITNAIQHFHDQLEELPAFEDVSQDDIPMTDRARFRLVWKALRGRSEWAYKTHLTPATYNTLRPEIDNLFKHMRPLQEHVQGLAAGTLSR